MWVLVTPECRVIGPVLVPPEWRARGFSGVYSVQVPIPTEVAVWFGPRAPCLFPDDMAWLLLAAEYDPHDVDSDGVMTLVRLDAAALVDKTATDRGVTPSSGGWW